MNPIQAAIDRDFGTIADLIRLHAAQDPQRLALVDDTTHVSYGELDAQMDRVATALQGAGLHAGDAIAICAAASVEYATVFLGALRAGVAVAPLAPGSVLFDRKKDLIISGGFNIYPSDIEAVVREHADVADVAVVGVPSEQWGETPVAFAVRRADSDLSASAMLQWANARLGKTQRLARLQWIDELPRSAIGKVLKRELRERDAAF